MCFSLKFFSLKSLTICRESTIFYVWIEMWMALFLKFVISKGMGVTLKFHISFSCCYRAVCCVPIIPFLPFCFLSSFSSLSFLFLFFFFFPPSSLSLPHCSLWQYLLLDLCCGGCHMHFIICRSHIWILARRIDTFNLRCLWFLFPPGRCLSNKLK
jgi:hypothetical protein